jgi:hypothetical protein
MTPSRKATKSGTVLLAVGVLIILPGLGTDHPERAFAGLLVLILGQLFRIEGAIRDFKGTSTGG